MVGELGRPRRGLCSCGVKGGGAGEEGPWPGRRASTPALTWRSSSRGGRGEGVGRRGRVAGGGPAGPQVPSPARQQQMRRMGRGRPLLTSRAAPDCDVCRLEAAEAAAGAAGRPQNPGRRAAGGGPAVVGQPAAALAGDSACLALPWLVYDLLQRGWAIHSKHEGHCDACSPLPRMCMLLMPQPEVLSAAHARAATDSGRVSLLAAIILNGCAAFTTTFLAIWRQQKTRIEGAVVPRAVRLLGALLFYSLVSSLAGKRGLATPFIVNRT